MKAVSKYDCFSRQASSISAETKGRLRYVGRTVASLSSAPQPHAADLTEYGAYRSRGVVPGEDGCQTTVGAARQDTRCHRVVRHREKDRSHRADVDIVLCAARGTRNLGTSYAGGHVLVLGATD
jgi:hypothetical protein